MTGEGKRRVRIDAGVGVQVRVDEVAAESPLVRSSHPTQIFRDLLGHRAVVSRLDVHGPVEPVGDHHAHEVRVWIEHVLYSDVAKVENLRSGPVQSRSNSRHTEGTDHVRADQVGVAHYRRKHVLSQVPDAQRQVVGGIQVVRRKPARFLITEEQRALLALLQVHFSEGDVFGIRRLAAEPKFAAWIAGCGEYKSVLIPGHKPHRSGREQPGIDLIVDERGPQSERPAIVALRRGECGKVTGEHRRGRNELPVLWRRLAVRRGLVTGEKEEFALLDGSPDRSAELVAPEVVSF